MMTWHLVYNDRGPNGVFGDLVDDFGTQICVILTRAYLVGGLWLPKLAPGTYICRRGQHQLEHGGPFITFQIMGVPPFMGQPVTGILFHIGNKQTDSIGCQLTGLERQGDEVLESGKAFEKFMGRLAGVDTFALVVS